MILRYIKVSQSNNNANRIKLNARGYNCLLVNKLHETPYSRQVNNSEFDTRILLK